MIKFDFLMIVLGALLILCSGITRFWIEKTKNKDTIQIDSFKMFLCQGLLFCGVIFIVVGIISIIL